MNYTELNETHIVYDNFFPKLELRDNHDDIKNFILFAIITRKEFKFFNL